MNPRYKKWLGATCVCVAVLMGLMVLRSRTQAAEESTAPKAIEKTACLRKMTLDLVHRGPLDAEISSISSGEKKLDQLALELMQTAEFRDVVIGWYAEKFPPTDDTLRLIEGDPDVDPPIAPIEIDVLEPIRIATHIVTHNLDYRTILTGNYAVADDGTVSDAGGAGLGVVATQHYMSAHQGSLRRAWGAHYMGEWADIELEAVTLDPNAEIDLSREGLKVQPCASCHYDEVHGIDMMAPLADCYRADGTLDTECTVQPGRFLTQAVANLQEMNQVTSKSKNFSASSVGFFFHIFFGRSMAKQELPYYARLSRAFSDSGYQPLTLIKTIVSSEEYCSR